MIKKFTEINQFYKSILILKIMLFILVPMLAFFDWILIPEGVVSNAELDFYADYLNDNQYYNFYLLTIVPILMLVSFVNYFFMYKYKKFSIKVFLITLIFIYVPIGHVAETPLVNFIDQIGVLCDGFLLALIYFSPIKDRFK